MMFILLAAALTVAPGVTCTTVQPGPTWVCVNGGWLPPGHPGIPVAPQPPVCVPVPNPYTEPERAAACTAWEAEHRPKPPLPTFVVGGIYTEPYSQTRISVLAVSLSLEGVPVVTAQQIVPASGYVFSFRTDAPQAQQWTRIQ